MSLIAARLLADGSCEAYDRYGEPTVAGWPSITAWALTWLDEWRDGDTSASPPNPGSVVSSSIPRDVGRGVVSGDVRGEGGALRIGLVAGTHIPQAASELWPQVFAAFADCDAILHGGDIYEQRLLDLLGDVAPTFAARGNGEERLGGWALDDSRVHDTWIVDAGGLRIGIIHDLTIPEVPPGLTVANVSRRRFGIDADVDGKLDVIIYSCAAHRCGGLDVVRESGFADLSAQSRGSAGNGRFLDRIG